MKPYRTSFLRMAAFVMLLCSLTSLHSQSAKAADCGFSLSSNDLTWTFNAVPGALQSRTLIITNTSTGPLVLNLSISGSEAFTVDLKHLTLKSGDTASVTISFKPGSTASGTLTGTLTIAKDGSDCHQSLGLSGTVTNNNHSNDVLIADPHEFNFGTVAVGTQACKEVKITNTSTSTVLNFTNGSLSCGNSIFTVTGLGISTLAPGASVTITICYKPIATGIQSTCNWSMKYTTMNGDGSIVINFSGTSSGDHNGDDALVADPHAFSFGQIPIGTTACKNVIVTNRSQSTVIIGEWSSQCDGKMFSITPGFHGKDTLAPGKSMTFTICFTPTGGDSVELHCNLTLQYYSNDSGATWKTLSISFYGIDPGTNGGHDGACLRTEQGDNFHDAIVVGGTADHTLYLINNTSHSITVNSATITGTDAGVFTLSSTLPITVPANSKNTTLTYTFAPTSSSKVEFTAAIVLSLSGDSLSCKEVEGHLIGYIVHNSNTTDTVVRPLFPAEHRTLGIEGSANHKASMSFYFTNNLSVDCTVNKIYLADGTYFTISSTNPTPAPFVLHPGDNLTVVVTYTATDNAVHHDHLMIDANHNLQAQDFDLQGLNLAASVPNALPTGVAINVSPNPASSYVLVNMAGIRSADIQVIDLLGNIQTSAKANSTWKWDASNFVSGSYIVRIAGTSVAGEQFVASKRVIVSK